MNEVIKKLIENENLVFELYTLFATRFPQYRTFWENIAAEESDHCKNLRKISTAVIENKAAINERAFNVKSVSDSINHIRTLISEVGRNKPDFTMKKALSEAINIENSMIELKYFSSALSKNEEILEFLNKIESETKHHYTSLKEMNASLK